MSATRTIYRDDTAPPATSEYLDVTVSSWPIAPSEDAADLTMTVAFTFDRATYYTGAWAGEQWTVQKADRDGTFVTVKRRVAQVLMTDDNLPADQTSTIYLRLTDNPETPVVLAGTLQVI